MSLIVKRGSVKAEMGRHRRWDWKAQRVSQYLPVLEWP